MLRRARRRRKESLLETATRAESLTWPIASSLQPEHLRALLWLKDVLESIVQALAKIGELGARPINWVESQGCFAVPRRNFETWVIVLISIRTCTCLEQNLPPRYAVK